MSETKKSTLDRAIESARMECAGARIEGERNSNPQQVLYHDKNGLSIVTNKSFFKLGMGIVEKNCAWCGKNFIPTRPEYAWGDCCSYTCCKRFDENRRDELSGCRAVVMMHPRKKTDILKFDSANDAGAFVGLEAKYIRNACNGLSETSGGYSWRWYDERPLYIEPDPPKRERKDTVNIYVRVSVIDTLDRVAAREGTSRSQLAARLIEEALEKEYGNVEENS